jgi:hypothetical protein
MQSKEWKKPANTTRRNIGCIATFVKIQRGMICTGGASRVNCPLAARQREEIFEMTSKVWCGGGLRTQERICTTFYSLF